MPGGRAARRGRGSGRTGLRRRGFRGRSRGRGRVARRLAGDAARNVWCGLASRQWNSIGARGRVSEGDSDGAGIGLRGRDGNRCASHRTSVAYYVFCRERQRHFTGVRE